MCVSLSDMMRQKKRFSDYFFSRIVWIWNCAPLVVGGWGCCCLLFFWEGNFVCVVLCRVKPASDIRE